MKVCKASVRVCLVGKVRRSVHKTRMYDKKAKTKTRDEERARNTRTLSISNHRAKQHYACRLVTATVRSLPASRLSNSPRALVSFLSCIM